MAVIVVSSNVAHQSIENDNWMEATNNKIKLVKTGETIDTEKHPYSTNYVNKKAFPKMERCSCQK